MRQEIESLRARLADLESRIGAAAGTAPAEPASLATAPAAPAPDKPAESTPRVETRGGIKVESADGKFSASLGGRIHYDVYAFDRDQAAVTGTTELRRARLTLQGKAHGWDYKLEQDFASGNNLEGLRDAYIARKLGPGKLTIGHIKPYRSMEELTSSNESMLMERPFATTNGLYSGRQYQQGVSYLVGRPNHTLGATVFNLRSASMPRNEGIGLAVRGTWAPINETDTTVHVGFSASHENANQGTPALSAVANYAGRRGPSLAIANVPAGSGQQLDVVALEAAASLGPLFFQGEYARADFGQPAASSQQVDAWYVQGSWLLGGGHRPYKSGTGVFGAASVPAGGAWELSARYDSIRNRDIAGREATAAVFGINYYVNPQLRFMLNYTRGDNEATGDKTNQFALRTQFNF